MSHDTIYALVGPSGCGKSALIQEMLRRFPNRLDVVKSTTTRPKRPGPEDDLFYHFVSDAEFDARLAAGHFVHHVRYGGNRYATDRRDIERVFRAGRDGINAFVEQGVINARVAGYRVTVIRIVPTGPYRGRDEIRAKDDAARAKIDLPADYEIENSFEPGGFARAVVELDAAIDPVWP